MPSGRCHLVRAAKAATAAMAAILLAACAGGDSEADQRVQQVSDAAQEAGLEPDVREFLELAARGLDSTYEARFTTTDGDETHEVVVSQRPPNRRIDVIDASGATESSFVLGGSSYECSKPGDGEWACTRAPDVATGGVAAGGVFDDETLAATIDAVRAASDTHDITVESRLVADVNARCLVTVPTAGDGPAERLCVSEDGAIVAIERGGERTVATSYTTEVPAERFELPAELSTTPGATTG